jgi:hypothetical protein
MSENFGSEQEHLNNVFGARLRITTLKGSAGPGVELLEYLAPGTGRPFPLDTAANDLWAWQTIVTMPDLAAASIAARAARARLISSDVVTATPHGAAFTARDPDGHAFVVRQRPERQ